MGSKCQISEKGIARMIKLIRKSREALPDQWQKVEERFCGMGRDLKCLKKRQDGQSGEKSDQQVGS